MDLPPLVLLTSSDRPSHSSPVLRRVSAYEAGREEAHDPFREAFRSREVSAIFPPRRKRSTPRVLAFDSDSIELNETVDPFARTLLFTPLSVRLRSRIIRQFRPERSQPPPGITSPEQRFLAASPHLRGRGPVTHPLRAAGRGLPGFAKQARRPVAASALPSIKNPRFGPLSGQALQNT